MKLMRPRKNPLEVAKWLIIFLLFTAAAVDQYAESRRVFTEQDVGTLTGIVERIDRAGRRDKYRHVRLREYPAIKFVREDIPGFEPGDSIVLVVERLEYRRKIARDMPLSVFGRIRSDKISILGYGTPQKLYFSLDAFNAEWRKERFRAAVALAICAIGTAIFLGAILMGRTPRASSRKKRIAV